MWDACKVSFEMHLQADRSMCRLSVLLLMDGLVRSSLLAIPQII